MNDLGISFEVIPAKIPELIAPNEKSEKAVVRLALEKALHVARDHPTRWVLGADTIVVLPGDPEKILGKPESEEHAVELLESLSGQVHWVLTGVALVSLDEAGDRLEGSAGWSTKSEVHFRELTKEEMWDYVRTGEPMDKAGAYGIQGGAKGFVDRFEGSWSNIVGLPLESLKPRLEAVGLLLGG